MNLIIKYGGSLLFALFVVTAITVMAHCLSTIITVLVTVLVTTLVVFIVLHFLRR